MGVSEPNTEADFRVTRRSQLRTPTSSRAGDEIAALMRVSAAAADAYRLEDVMEQAAEAALEVTGASSLSISRWERERDALRTLINVGELGPGEERFPDSERYPLSEYPIVARLLEEGRPYHSTVDDPEAPSMAVDLLRTYGKESEIAVPIFLDGAVWGEVWASTRPGSRRFDGSDVRFLQAIADRLALVLSRAERYSRVSRLAYEDPLTGLANRRAVDERLEILLSKDSVRGPLTMLLCDVDGLKQINDVHGHHAGDRALCRIGEALLAAAAPVGAAFVGRLGGDEFCVLLEGCEAEAPSQLAATALDLLAIEGELPLSLSFGAATATPHMEPSDLLRAADRAQYSAKRRGGGRLCTAEEEVPANTGEHGRVNGRDNLEERLDRTMADAIGLLDADLTANPVLDRIEAVVGAFAGALGVAAWAVSTWDLGSTVIKTVSTADDRASRLRGERVELQHRIYRLADFPQTAELVRAGNGGFVARADDESSDPAEAALLADRGFPAVLAASVRQYARSYLVELYADAGTLDLAPAAVRLQAALRIAAAGAVAT